MVKMSERKISCFFFRNSNQRCFVGKCALRRFAKFTAKHLCQILFFRFGLGPATLMLKKRLWHRCFPVNFEKFIRAPSVQYTSRRLLLFNCLTTLNNFISLEVQCFPFDGCDRTCTRQHTHH